MYDKARMLIRLTSNIFRCTQGYVDKKMEAYQLTTGSYPYLLVLNKHPGISQNDISKELNVDKAMSARTIKKLIELGYIKKEGNEEDIRAYKLYITDKGKHIVPEVLQILNEWIEILTKDNKETEIDTSIAFLEKILENGKKYKRDHCERMKSVD